MHTAGVAPFDPLSSQQAFALIEEITSTRNLLGYGEKTIRNARFLETTFDPILTMLSIGVEKLLKMSLGLANVADHGAWPSIAVMKHSFGHGTVEMDAALRTRLREGIAGRSNEPYLRELLERVDQDPVWPKLLAALDMYGRSGRFYYLDILGERPQEWEAPRTYWDAAENVVLDSDEALHTRWSAALASGDIDSSNRIIIEIQGRVADSMRHWWDMVANLAINGALGEAGRSFGFDVRSDMVGRQ